MSMSLSQRAQKLALALCSVLAAGLCASPLPAAAVTLPDGRAFEEVTPVHMNGARAIPILAAGNGETVTFQATGGFGDARSGGLGDPTYQANRTPTGWQSDELLPPASEYSAYLPLIPPLDMSSDLTKSLIVLKPEPFSAIIDLGVSPHYYYIQESDGSAGRSTPTREVDTTPQGGIYAGTYFAAYAGGSSDLSRLFFWTSFTERPLQLVEDDLTDTGAPRYRMVSIVGPNNADGSGKVISQCGEANYGDSSEIGGGSTFHAISADGSTVFFTISRCIKEFGVVQEPGVDELFARVNGSTTVPISEPSVGYCSTENYFINPTPASCAGAQFKGASGDGSKVFFTSTQSDEVNGVTDISGNLYEAELDSSGVKRMIQISAGDPGGEARVQGVVRISDDGSHVYFVAQGALTSTMSSQGQAAQEGADNLYVYDNGETHFIGELCSGLNASASVSDSACPSTRSDQSLWSENEEHEAWAAPFGNLTANGRFLVFDTRAQLIGSGEEADTDAAEDVYEYDSQTGTLRRVSVGRNGFNDNGNNSLDATISIANYGRFGGNAEWQSSSGPFGTGQSIGGRPVSNDGSYVFFSTEEALEADDVNEAPDVYEWHNGLVSLISDGENPGKNSTLSEATATVFVGSSADGRDVFFTSPDALVPEAGSNPAVIYDARIGGGFQPPIVPPPCREDACQGTISLTPSFPSPSSALYSSGGNVASLPVKSAVKLKPKKKATKPKPKLKRTTRRKSKKAAANRKGRK